MNAFIMTCFFAGISPLSEVFSLFYKLPRPKTYHSLLLTALDIRFTSGRTMKLGLFAECRDL